MKKKATEIGGYILSLLFFYATFNFTRNVFLKPVFYDVFLSEKRRAVTVIGPYYSLQGFAGASCACTFSGGRIVLPANIVSDPDKNCMIVLFNFPDTMPVPENFDYVIMRGKKKLFSGTYSRDAAHSAKNAYNIYKLSIATLFKYETDFLAEWIEHHRSVGVEHFYIYENNAAPSAEIAAILGPYIREGLVSHILWPHPYRYYNYKLRKLWPNDAHAYAQVPQINHCLYKFGSETEWLLSCDVDEYFYSPAYGDIRPAIGATNKERDVSSIRIAGFWFGGASADLAKAKVAGVRASFTRSEKEPTSACKCIFDTASVRLASVHNSVLRDAREINVSRDILRFNHYRALGWQKRLDADFAREIENTDILCQKHST